MDLTKLSKSALLAKCEEMNIKKCKSKTKDELISLIKNANNNIEFIIEEETPNQSPTHYEKNIDSDTSSEDNESSSNKIININSNILEYEKKETYLNTYLSSIRNKNGTYKRVCSSPLRYAGGKTKAIGLILENLPKLREKKIVSPFFGGGSVELCLSQTLDIQVIGYDIFGLLVNFWNVLIHNKDEFINELKKFDINEDEFTYNRHVLLNYWDKIKPAELKYVTKKKVLLKDEDLTKLDNNKIMQAVHYYYNMTLSYGPMFLGWPSSNEINAEKFKRKITKLEQLNLKNLSVECKNFAEILEQHKDDFLFLDPPYYLDGDSKMFKGMYPNCNFAIHHNNFDHVNLATLLKQHQGGFLLTYNNCSKVREMYEDCLFEYPEWQYTYGQGEKRIGKNREKNTSNNVKESHEIIIIKWPA